MNNVVMQLTQLPNAYCTSMQLFYN